MSKSVAVCCGSSDDVQQIAVLTSDAIHVARLPPKEVAVAVGRLESGADVEDELPQGRHKIVPLDAVQSLQWMDGRSTVSIEHGAAAPTNVAGEDAAAFLPFVDALVNAVGGSKSSEPAGVMELIRGPLIAGAIVAFFGFLMTMIALEGPDAPVTGRRQASKKLLGTIAGLFGVWGCIAVTAIVLGLIAVPCLKELKARPEKHTVQV